MSLLMHWTRERQLPRSTERNLGRRHAWRRRWWTPLCGRPLPRWPYPASPSTACAPLRSTCWAAARAGPSLCASGPPLPSGSPLSPSSSLPSTGRWTSFWTPACASCTVRERSMIHRSTGPSTLREEEGGVRDERTLSEVQQSFPQTGGGNVTVKHKPTQYTCVCDNITRIAS